MSSLDRFSSGLYLSTTVKKDYLGSPRVVALLPDRTTGTTYKAWTVLTSSVVAGSGFFSWVSKSLTTFTDIIPVVRTFFAGSVSFYLVFSDAPSDFFSVSVE